jgi:hypothetical protein
MPNKDDILWFKQQFQAEIEAAASGTPFCVDMISAVACQETGEIWPILRKKDLSVDEILKLCVGDTLDADRGRRAFPKTKENLLSKPNGQEMFSIARQALVDMAHYINGYKGAASNPDKFCHGFGMFQLDLQFFLDEPDYFLQQQYADFGICLSKCIGELASAMQRMGWQGKTTLTDYEKAYVAIAYNTGRFIPSKGLKQGYYDGTRYYGEYFFNFLRLSKTVAIDSAALLSQPLPGNAIVAAPSPVTATGAVYEVDVRTSPLRLRREPKIDPANRNSNVIANLPDGQLVQAVTGEEINGFLEVETSLQGAHYHGFASVEYLKKSSSTDTVPVPEPEQTPPDTGIVAVYAPRRTGSVTKRTEIADALSLNEPGQPGRNATTPEELCSELAAIIDWLGVDDPAHLRYQPNTKATFCNIYAHDFCHLAGVYLPRVWWTPGAIERLAKGENVPPLLGNTIDEQRANDLYRWMRDFGLRFGWRQTGTLTKLQMEVNQGAVGLIVARRKEDGRPGHIVAVVPETEAYRAKRDTSGEVIAPLQSQAGSTNFRYGTGRVNWWLGEQFAESDFWLHA